MSIEYRARENEELVILGEAMQKFAVANWILMGSSVLAYIIMMAMYIPMMMRSMEYLESSSDPNPFSEIGLMNFAFVIPFIIILLIGLYVFYRQIKFLFKYRAFRYRKDLPNVLV